jgi:plasmid replication initiation protein
LRETFRGWRCCACQTNALHKHDRRAPVTSEQILSLIYAVKLHSMVIRWHVAGARQTCRINYQKIQVQHLQRRASIVQREALTTKDDKLDEIIAFGIVAISLFFCHPKEGSYCKFRTL